MTEMEDDDDVIREEFRDLEPSGYDLGYQRGLAEGEAKGRAAENSACAEVAENASWEHSEDIRRRIAYLIRARVSGAPYSHGVSLSRSELESRCAELERECDQAIDALLQEQDEADAVDRQLAALKARLAEVQEDTAFLKEYAEAAKKDITALTIQLEASQDALKETMNDCAALQKRIDEAPILRIHFVGDKAVGNFLGHEQCTSCFPMKLVPMEEPNNGD